MALTNVALNKTVTASASVSNLTLVTDGSTASSPYADCGPGLVYVQIDLGAIYFLDTISVWHYWADSRTYSSTKTQISENGTDWTDVFNSATAGTYAESSGGKVNIFTAKNTRYIRDYVNGSSANAYNHWVEIQAFEKTLMNFLSLPKRTRFPGLVTEAI